jgi:hypothetical protein
VDGRHIGQDQLVESGEAVDHFLTVEIDRELAFLHIDARHDAEIRQPFVQPS